jgi:nucleoside 2-deoxyribosyltransferase
MDISFSFQLREIHKHILTALFFTDVQTRQAIDPAIRVLSATNYDYPDLLKKMVSKMEGPSHVGLPSLTLNLSADFKNPNDEEIRNGLIILEELGLIRSQPVYQSTVISHYTYFLTEEGKRTAGKVVEERQVILRPPHKRRTSIFVASAFAQEDIDLLYESEFKTACASVNCKPFHVDLDEPSQTITDAILRGISEARCIIADLTYARPSVYFEVGFAYGLGVPLILTCRQDHHKGHEENMKVHFDLEQYKISYWNRAKDGTFLWPKNMHPSERLKTVLK